MGKFKQAAIAATATVLGFIGVGAPAVAQQRSDTRQDQNAQQPQDATQRYTWRGKVATVKPQFAKQFSAMAPTFAKAAEFIARTENPIHKLNKDKRTVEVVLPYFQTYRGKERYMGSFHLTDSQ